MDASHAPEVVPSQEAPQVYYKTKDNESALLRKSEKRILGLRRETFWLLLLLLLIVVAAAVGGVSAAPWPSRMPRSTSCLHGLLQHWTLYTDLVHRQSSGAFTPSGTPTPNSPASASSSLPSSSSGGGGGSPTTSGAYVAPTDVMLPLPCDDPTPSVTVAGTVYKFNATCGVDHPKGDLLPIVAYSLHDCLAACGKYNSKWGSAGGCAGVVFGADLAKFVASASGNCYLKNSTSSDVKEDGVISAVLMGSV